MINEKDKICNLMINQKGRKKLKPLAVKPILLVRIFLIFEFK